MKFLSIFITILGPIPNNKKSVSSNDYEKIVAYLEQFK